MNIPNEIPGVYLAKQKRSIIVRDAYIETGVDLLNQTRLQDITVADLAKTCGYSVGGFYARFEDKEAFFAALRFVAIHACNEEIEKRTNKEYLASQSTVQALENLVDLMADLFTGRMRGVLRESLLRILEPDDPWAPMRQSAKKIISNLHIALADQFPSYTSAQARTRLSFCFQLIVGALQNDLVNDYHVFSSKDESLREGLKEAVCAYMGITKETN